MNTKKIYMSNHVSDKDIAFLNAELDKSVHFVLFNEYEYKQNEKTLQNRTVTSFNQLDSKSINSTIELINSGEPILIFPENRISNSGILMKIYKELAFVAFTTGAQILPTFIDHTNQDSMDLHIGNPFTLSNFQDAKGETGKLKLAQYIHNKLNSHQFDCIKKQEINLFNEVIEVSNRVKNQKYAIKDNSNIIDYKKLLLNSYTLGAKFQKDIADDTVGVLLPNSIGFVVTLLSLFKASIRPALLNFTMGDTSLLDCCETAGLKSIITSREFIDKADLYETIKLIEMKYQIIYIEDIKENLTAKDKLTGLKNSAISQKAQTDNTEIILFTSGSTNKPKGVVLTHDNIIANVQQSTRLLDINISNDVMFNPLPMFHSFGLTAGTFLPILMGIPLVTYPAPTHYKVIPDLIYQEDATIILGTATFFNGWGKMAQPFDFKTVRYAIAGAEKVKEDTKRLFTDKFGITIIEGYGATETAPILSLNTPLFNQEGSVGAGLPGIEYKIEPVEGIDKGGSLLVKGPNVMKGYLIHNEGFKKHQGWYNTGDIVLIDDSGFITITSRLKRFAKVGGEMVSLNLVEQLCSEVYGSIEFAAVAVPDKRKGEKIVLFTTINEIKNKEIKKHIKSQKQTALLNPSEIKVVESIPLLGTGKTDYVFLEREAKSLYER